MIQLRFAHQQAARDRGTAWDSLHTLASVIHDPLAQAIVAIGYHEGWSIKDDQKSHEYGAL